MAWSDGSERLRRRILKPWNFKAYLWLKLPLAACAGLGLESLDERSCTVRLPGGWRTQNPFRSTYFAAQCMAAEMATGAPALVLAAGASGSISMLLREVRALYGKRIQGPSRYVFGDVAGMQAVVERAASSGESEAYTGRVTGRAPDGSVASDFEITWSFKRRG
ncbi:MAG: DUF4442 domain-containing protein [Acidobacteria bacterium]|nr:DUF4442 domain-containing protein [Acidobacteriota bacterium]